MRDEDRLKDELLTLMRVGIQQVVDGTLEVYEVTLMPPAQVLAFLDTLGFDTDVDLSNTNGWQWDYWFYVMSPDDVSYRLSGGGYYGGMKFEKGEER